MRELERDSTNLHPPITPRALTRVAVVGRGRLGTTMAAALRDAGYDSGEPAGRGEAPEADAIVLCVPDAEIASAAEAVAGGAPLVGHTSGATPLTALEPARRAGAELFGLHPLQTFAAEGGARLSGCGCAVAGSTPAALAAAERIAADLGMAPFRVEDAQRAAYHAAASISSNFLVTLQAEAEALAKSAGIDGFDARRMLGPLVRTSVENWIELGPRQALTGPISRGDHETVRAQRAAIAERRPELTPAFDALVERTEALAERALA
jgi:predicted short-subunit dehydrogenase-like oxidoreductase (DUF2520 family)